MDWDRIQGNWKQMTGKVKEKWGKLTSDQLAMIAGKRDQLSGTIQATYGITTVSYTHLTLPTILRV